MDANNHFTAWAAKGVSDLYLRDTANVLDYIPRRLWSQITTNAPVMDVSSYLNAAHTAAAGAAGAGGKVYYPAGTYLASGILVYPGQTVLGAGPSATTIVQGSTDSVAQDNNSVFITSQWENSSSTYSPVGPVIRDLAVKGTAGSAGYAIINYSHQSRLERLSITNIPILMTAVPVAAPSADMRTDQTTSSQNHRLTDIVFTNCAPSAIVGDSPVTDTMVTFCTFNGCGSTGAAAIQVKSLAGWHIIANKITGCPNSMIAASAGSDKAIISRNNFVMTCSQAATAYVGISLNQDSFIGLCIVGNTFRIEPVATSSHVSCTFLQLHVTVAHGGSLAHFGNRYSYSSANGAVVPTAFNVTGSTPVTGVSTGNTYDNFGTLAAQGSGEYSLPLSVQAVVLPKAPNATQSGSNIAIFCTQNHNLAVSTSAGILYISKTYVPGT